ncbi:hypothetical protein HDV00_002481 [Rhizophlyctis rosea]|nr:hypothetical protein HDV00_002481 [Rhizophlyctis rosea]
MQDPSRAGAANFRSYDANPTGSRVVFVGNIPYDLTEPQLIEIFNEVGPVVSFRLLFDRDSGKPKGYGFCTFQDADTAASAVRNLNGYDVGGRQLRIDFAESDKDELPTERRRPEAPRLRDYPPATAPSQTSQPVPPIQQQAPQQSHQQPVQQPFQQPFQQSLPQQTAVQPQVQQQQSSVEVIGKTLSTYSKQQMMELISSLKLTIQTNPDTVRTLLTDNPQLTYAVFQALLVMNLVEPAAMQRILQSQGVSAAQQPGLQANPPRMPVGMSPQVPPVNPALMPVQPMMAPVPAVGQMSAQQFVRPPVPAPTMQAAPPVNPQMQQGQSLNDILQEQQKALLLQVLNMTPEQISAMPPDQREKILALRAQVLGQS